MVQIHVKKGEESQFLLDCTASVPMNELTVQVATLYNDRLRIGRLCDEIELLADHGIAKPPNMVGLTDDQIEELKLKDEWSDRSYPSGGSVFNADGVGRRTGSAPIARLAEVMKRTVAEAKAAISPAQAKAGVALTPAVVKDALDKLRGAVMIVYPMGLPPYDEVRLILEDKEELAGKQAALAVIESDQAALWWAGKDLTRDKLLSDFIGRNEKTKIIVKIQKRGQGAPVREPVVDEETQRKMMQVAYKRQEELKKLESADDDAYMNSAWADPSALKSRLQGLDGMAWRPK